MPISDRLDEMEDDIHDAFRLPKAAPVALVVEEDAPDMLAALRAVLDLHQFYDQCDEGCCRYCESCEHEWPCPTAVAITASLREEA